MEPSGALGTIPVQASERKLETSFRLLFWGLLLWLVDINVSFKGSNLDLAPDILGVVLAIVGLLRLRAFASGPPREHLVTGVAALSLAYGVELLPAGGPAGVLFLVVLLLIPVTLRGLQKLCEALGLARTAGSWARAFGWTVRGLLPSVLVAALISLPLALEITTLGTIPWSDLFHRTGRAAGLPAWVPVAIVLALLAVVAAGVSALVTAIYSLVAAFRGSREARTVRGVADSFGEPPDSERVSLDPTA